MNRVTIQTITLGSALALSGLAAAQTSPAPAPAHTGASSSASPAPVSSGIAAPVDPNKVVLSIDGDNMTAAQFDTMIKAFPPQVQAAATGPQRHTFIEQYVQLRVAAREAERLNLQAKPEVKMQLAIQHDYVIEMLQNIFVFTLQEAYQHAVEVDARGRTVLITCELPQAEFARDQVQSYGPDWRLDRSKGSMSALVEPAGCES